MQSARNSTVNAYLQNQQEKKVSIGYSLELFKQVERQESEEVVFWCFNWIVLQGEKENK